MLETYKVYVKCENCGFKGEIEIPKECKVNHHECPNCDCSELVLFKKRLIEKFNL